MLTNGFEVNKKRLENIAKVIKRAISICSAQQAGKGILSRPDSDQGIIEFSNKIDSIIVEKLRKKLKI